MNETSMPEAALVMYGVFLALAFGLRSAVHWRRTGTTGFVLPSPNTQLAERVGGVLFVGAIVGGGLAPLLQRRAVLVPLATLDGPISHAIGMACMIAGVVGTVWAQFSMGESWRVGVDPTAHTALVARGPFRWVRNPIYTNMLLASVGLTLMVPNIVALVTLVVMLVGLELQVRWVEEPYLLRTHGDDYRGYAAATGRFLPGVGRGRRGVA